MESQKTSSKQAAISKSETLPKGLLTNDVEVQRTTEPYSIFDKRQKRMLTVVLGIASLASPLTANIYLPLIPSLETQYASSTQAINLTITLYVVVQAITPAFFAPAADAHGRRPITLVAFIIFTLGSLGLALNDLTKRSYVGLLLLRAVEALGASVCASITYGVISDVCIPAERGSMVGPVISAANVGTVLGPVLGGLIAWRTGNATWVFVALTLYGVANTLLTAVCLPETARVVVGNGAEGKRLRNTGLWELLLLGPLWGQTGNMTNRDRALAKSSKTIANQDNSKKRFTIPNPLSCLSIMLWKDTALIIFLASCNYAVWYTVLASIPQVYSDFYGWSELLVGLAYLPSAITVVIAGFINGPWTNWRFRRTAQEVGLPADSHHVDGFPIELARTRGLWPVLVGTYAGVAGLGWAIQARTHVAVLLAVQAVAGFLQVFLFFSFNTLLVDVNPDRPSTASAAASLVRSGLSGVGIAIVDPLIRALGWGGYFTLMAGVIGIMQGIGMVILTSYGQSWREERRAIERAK